MKTRSTTISTPELLVLIRLLTIGFLLAEIWRLSTILGLRYAQANPDANLSGWCFFMGMVHASIILYAHHRGACKPLGLMLQSTRLDLLLVLVVGGWANWVIGNVGINALDSFHELFMKASPDWVLLVLAFAALPPISSIFLCILPYFCRKNVAGNGWAFLSDKAIDSDDDDLMDIKYQAKEFAKNVLRGAQQPGLVFGLDGAWGAGKTSFINLAEQHWTKAEDQVIVCRFEPLRYATEVDLPERLIQELIAVIQSKAYAPEFRPAASRYARWLKGKAEFSFLGLNLALEPSSDTVDELLEDIDRVLERINRRVIIVIDDLDRLEREAVNRVLFATQRTFGLKQVCYVLCYDTAMLMKEGPETEKTREFLEKFIAVKRNLISDFSDVRKYLKGGWAKDLDKENPMSAERFDKFSSVLSKFDESLKPGAIVEYAPFIGGLRKVKRIINLMVIVDIEKIKWGETDFNEADFFNILLIYLYYSDVFRDIYLEETNDGEGVFSLKRKQGGDGYENAKDFNKIIARYPEGAQFILRKLFDANVLGFNALLNDSNSNLASRACFNESEYRSLRKYLEAINSAKAPEFGGTLANFMSILRKANNSESFDLIAKEISERDGLAGHMKFWRQLRPEIDKLEVSAVDSILHGLIDCLPDY